MDDGNGNKALGAEVQRIAAKQKRMKTYVFVVNEVDEGVLSVHMCIDEAMQACGYNEVVQVMQVR